MILIFMEVPSNVLKNNLYLPLSMFEATYLRGALRNYVKGLKQSDERDYMNMVLDRLNNIVLDVSSFNNVPY